MAIQAACKKNGQLVVSDFALIDGGEEFFALHLSGTIAIEEILPAINAPLLYCDAQTVFDFRETYRCLFDAPGNFLVGLISRLGAAFALDLLLSSAIIDS